LLPAAVRTYAPCRETPELRYRFWDHASVMSAITPQGKLYTMTQEETFKGPSIVRFLKHLLRHIPRQTVGHLGCVAGTSQPRRESLLA